jgi:hypothetical protein
MKTHITEQCHHFGKNDVICKRKATHRVMTRTSGLMPYCDKHERTDTGIVYGSRTEGADVRIR